MQDDCISVALGLPELMILEQRELKTYFEITVRYRCDAAECPRCGHSSNKVHDQKKQSKQDRRLRDKPVFLNLIKRRFRCLWCGKVWSEPDPVFGTRRRSSQRFRDYLGQEALHQTVKRTAEKERVGEGLVRRCVTEMMGKMMKQKEATATPELIGLDEFSVSRRLYHTAICNLTSGEVMEVVEGQGRQKVQAYLETFSDPERVKAVAMDMHEPFREAVQMCLPRAKVVADKFHVIRHLNGIVDAVRVRLQGGKKKRGELFKRRYSLLKGTERLNGWEKAKLSQLFQLYPDLKEAWLLKESFRAWYRQVDRKQAEASLKSIEEKIEQGNVPEFRELRYILSEWREELLNYFDYPVTNGLLEGKNNRIKTIKRTAYGYRNMANFRLRILATNYKGEEAISHLLT